jgi:hypothetical protein
MKKAPTEITPEEQARLDREAYDDVHKRLKKKWNIPELGFGKRDLSEADLLKHLRRRLGIKEIGSGTTEWSDSKVNKMIHNAPEDVDKAVVPATERSIRIYKGVRLAIIAVLYTSAASAIIGVIANDFIKHNRSINSDDEPEVSTTELQILEAPDLDAQLARFALPPIEIEPGPTSLDIVIDQVSTDALGVALQVSVSATEMAADEQERQERERQRARERERERERERARQIAELQVVAAEVEEPEQEQPETNVEPRTEVQVRAGIIIYNAEGTRIGEGNRGGRIPSDLPIVTITIHPEEGEPYQTRAYQYAHNGRTGYIKIGDTRIVELTD